MNKAGDVNEEKGNLRDNNNNNKNNNNDKMMKLTMCEKHIRRK